MCAVQGNEMGRSEMKDSGNSGFKESQGGHVWMGTQRSRDEWGKKREDTGDADKGNMTHHDNSNLKLKALKRKFGGPGGREPDDASREAHCPGST